MTLAAKVQELNDRGVTVTWTAEMDAAGYWIAECSTLLLSASHSVDDQMASCDDVLLLTEVSAGS